jgi:hypothetical protein
MSKKKKKNILQSIPPCPDPRLYKLVRRKDCWYWSLKRGSIKKVVLNDILQKNSSTFKITSPVASRIKKKLEEFTRGLSISSLHSKLNGILVKTYNEKGVPDFSQLKGFEIQPDHPLEKILLTQYHVQQMDHSIEIHIPVEKGIVKQYNGLVTDFYFEGILLYGDALSDKSLEVEYVVSQPYRFKNTAANDCKLSLALPEKKEPWALLLKVSCLEGNEMAAHAKHYGMKVVEVSG